MITVDHGSSNEAYIKQLKDIGIDTVITDHHKLKDDTPPASATVFVNPQQETVDTFKCLSGCAVAYLVVYELLSLCGKPIDKDNEMLGLVAISTIGDMMAMDNEINRALCIHGIKQLNESKLGKAFKQVLKKDVIDSTVISFFIVPMINSCSRVDDSLLAYISLSDNDEDIMRDNIAHLAVINKHRKVHQNSIVTREALPQINPNDNSNVILVSQKALGINGIISSSIGESTKKPTITFIVGEKQLNGSCRGIVTKLNVKTCFDWIHHKDSNIMVSDKGDTKYGGHDGAAGCTIHRSKLDDFVKLFRQYMDDNDIRYVANNDTIRDDSIDIQNTDNLLEEINLLDKLEPYGNKWKKPLFRLSLDKVTSSRGFPISSNTKLTIVKGKLNDMEIECKKFSNIDEDVEVKGMTLVGTLENKDGKVVLDIKHIIP